MSISYKQVIWFISEILGCCHLVSYVTVASEVLQQFDFPECSLGEDLFAKDIGHLLDGGTLAGLLVQGGTVACQICWYIDK